MKEGPPEATTADTRRLAAIMFTDIVGFSRQMGADEARMLRLLAVHNQVIEQAVAEHHGHIIKTVGDAFLVDFPSVVNAVQCAQHIQAQFRTHNTDKGPAEQIHVRIGIHLGDIVQRDGDVFGDGVNVASRLQALAEPDTICISHVVYQEVAKKLSLGAVVSLGRPKLKNIAERQPVYALLPEKPQGLRQTLRVQRLKLSRRAGTAHRVVAVVALLVLVSVGSIAIKTRYFPSAPALPLPDKPSIVVLPFVNMSNDPAQEYFSDGITEDITTDLSKTSSLFVIARNSAFTYKGKPVKVQEVSKDLGVQYVLEGSVRKVDNRVLISAQLVDATRGYHLWSERYERELKDIFALQEEIRRKIVVSLAVKLTDEDRGRLTRAYTGNLDAYDSWLRGVEYWNRSTKEANTQARQMFEKAIVLDPTYAVSYASLGFTYYLEWVWQWSQDPQSLEQAFALAQKALALDGSLPSAHVLLGYVSLWKNRQHDLAITEGERALALDPNCAACYSWLATVQNYIGRPEEAIKLEEKALRLDPRNQVNPLMLLGWSYFLARRYEEAIATLKRAITLNPNFLVAHLSLASVYGELDREEEARAEAAEVLRLSPKFSLEAWGQRLPYKDPAALERQLVAWRKAGLK
jgi:adenylate cyclase